jgi:hypothetical protein
MAVATTTGVQLFLNDGVGHMTEDTTTPFYADQGPDAYAGDVALVDVDGSGSLDLVVTGSSSFSSDDRVYMNTGACHFTRDNTSSLLVRSDDVAGTHANSMAWADYDGDGDSDVLMLLTGISSPGWKLLKNGGGGQFTEVSGHVQFGNATTDCADCDDVAVWGDTDNDGDVDLLVLRTGTAGVLTAYAQLYRNDGADTFTHLPGCGINPPKITTDTAGTATIPLDRKMAAFGDLSGDGLLDLIIATGGHASAPRLYRNAGSNTFVDISSSAPWTGLASEHVQSVAIGDFDHDAVLDVLFGVRRGTSLLYRGHGGMTFASADLPSPTHFSAGTMAVALAECVTRIQARLESSSISWLRFMISRGYESRADRLTGDGYLEIVFLAESDKGMYTFQHCATGAYTAEYGCVSCPGASLRDSLADVCIQCAENYEASGSVCEQCSPGNHRPYGGVDDCAACPQGKASPGRGASCSDCAEGCYASTSGSVSCTPCGARLDPSTPCRSGNRDSLDRVSLNRCAAGSFANGTSSTVCTIAPIGFYAGVGAAQASQCSAGFYGSSTSRPDSSCSGSCSAGHFCPAGSTSSTQFACPAGTYNGVTGSGSNDSCIVSRSASKGTVVRVSSIRAFESRLDPGLSTRLLLCRGQRRIQGLRRRIHLRHHIGHRCRIHQRLRLPVRLLPQQH